MRYAIAIVLAGALAGCGDGESHRVTAEEYGDAWPFTVKVGYLACFGRDRQATIEADVDGRRVAFALNAAAEYGGYHPLDAITKPGGDVRPIRDKAERRCPPRR